MKETNLNLPPELVMPAPAGDFSSWLISAVIAFAVFVVVRWAWNRGLVVVLVSLLAGGVALAQKDSNIVNQAEVALPSLPDERLWIGGLWGVFGAAMALGCAFIMLRALLRIIKRGLRGG